MRQQLGRAGLRCAVLEHASKANKDLRILEAFDAVMAAKRLAIHDSVLHTAFVREARENEGTLADKLAEFARKLGVTESAVQNFLRILGEKQVPPERLLETLASGLTGTEES